MAARAFMAGGVALTGDSTWQDIAVPPANTEWRITKALMRVTTAATLSTRITNGVTHYQLPDVTVSSSGGAAEMPFLEGIIIPAGYKLQGSTGTAGVSAIVGGIGRPTT